MANKQVKVILREPVAQLGRRGDVVTVAAGYARNYLLPEGIAFAWNKGAEKEIEAMQKARRAEELATRETAVATKEKLDGITLTITAKVSESGKLFGGISADKIVEELAKKDITVNAKSLTFAPIRKTGTAEVKAQLHPEIAAQFTVSVEAE
ncbi:MAG: 50S ribosomal protein L9 [Aeriscardovia sp.]|nr:50S ribosomal protein L9 [Aeriscardovia sp.]MBQ9687613.1 50S ribosomal protein L9 [Aeriscardovia sp.]MBR2554385.1 50S ribosomal protein L9 [Aeriscardovia sp.]MBR3359608.1 50S ribosomal protein L9 [Aeriscardovia sp.]MBR4414626.1 50S ribosomal protein L9 [Aeriscardovia sp.]